MTTEKVITQDTYEISKHLYLITYTAMTDTEGSSWCPPCNKIKPYIKKYMEMYTLIKTQNMPKIEYQEKIFKVVPYFVINDDQGNSLASIQTSSSVILHVFLNKNGIDVPIDEDF